MALPPVAKPLPMQLRGHLVSSARCPRVETDLAAAVLSSILNLDQSILYIFPCQSIRLTQTESQRADGGLNCNLGARALLLARGLGSALEC